MSMTGSAIQYEVRHPVSFAALLFGAAAAPIFWTGQYLLGYIVTAHWCYPGDHPEAIAQASTLWDLMLAFDIVAILVALAGGITAWMSYMKVRVPPRDEGDRRLAAAEGRARFLAIWGLFSSLWFLGAIAFNTIASMTVPPCLN